MPRVRYDEIYDLIREEKEGLTTEEIRKKDKEEKLKRSKRKFIPNEPEENMGT